VTTRSFARLLAILGVLCTLGFVTRADADGAAYTPRELKHVGVTEHLGGQLPLATKFRDQTGKPVELADFFDGVHPVVLTFAYHTCPVLCGMVLNNEADGLKQIPWTLGKEYRAITISIDPNESLERTAAKRKSILFEYGRPSNEDWTFLVGDAPSIAAVANAAGFEYQYDERQKQWGHPSLVMIVTPDGKMARYLYGIEFPANDLRLGLIEAKKGNSVSTVEKIILYCYHYDPQGGKYVLMANRVMQVACGGIALVFAALLASLWIREIKRAKKKKKTPPAPAEEAAATSS
jgi:protein SCO1/2